jgi:hypothetical protein
MPHERQISIPPSSIKLKKKVSFALSKVCILNLNIMISIKGTNVRIEIILLWLAMWLSGLWHCEVCRVFTTVLDIS